ncbi:uncharacterized MFS-type transporter YbfB-like isoform X2 [Acanthaster planci]|nr:uncharacterized MFS-type transporter YbfB-like isoform X2 [Acanthaster planci]
MTQLFLDTYGWRGATLLIAGFSMHQIPTAVLVKAVNPQYKSLADADNRNDSLHNFDTEIKEAEKRRKSSAPVSFKELCSLIYRALDLGIFLEFNFWIVLMCRFGVTTSFISWLLYFVPHLQAKGFNPQVAASLCIAAAVGFSFGTLIWSPFIDRGLIKSSTAIIITSLVLTLSFVVDPWVHDVIGYAITAFVCGLFSSALYTLTDVITKEIVDNDRLVAAFGWMRAFFFGRLIAGFVPGWIYDMRGSYDLAFIVIGLIPTFSLLPLVIALIRKTI